MMFYKNIILEVKEKREITERRGRLITSGKFSSMRPTKNILPVVLWAAVVALNISIGGV